MSTCIALRDLISTAYLMPVRLGDQRSSQDSSTCLRARPAKACPQTLAALLYGDQKSLPIAENHPKPSQEMSEQFRLSFAKLKGYCKNSHQEVRLNCAKNLGRPILRKPFSGPNRLQFMRFPSAAWLEMSELDRILSQHGWVERAAVVPSFLKSCALRWVQSRDPNRDSLAI